MSGALISMREVAQALQAQRDNRRVSGSLSRTNRGAEVRSKERAPGTKKQREFTQADIDDMIVQLAQRDLQAKKQQRKPRQRSARVS